MHIGPATPLKATTTPRFPQIHSTHSHDHLFEVRVAYQTPFSVTLPGASAAEVAHPYTFEDALAFENLEFFSKLAGTGLVRKFREAIDEGKTIAEVSERMFEALRVGSGNSKRLGEARKEDEPPVPEARSNADQQD
jgi:hypothetical protein